MSFAVTGLGRCGTMALARILNTAEGWTVRHQTDSHELRLGFQKSGHWRRFSDKNYGEVSSALLPVVTSLPCDSRAVIVRSVVDTAISAANYSASLQSPLIPLIDKLPWTLKMIDEMIVECNVEPFFYDELMSGRREIERLAGHLGINKLGGYDLTTRHNSSKKEIFKISELKPEHRKIVEASRWFDEKWLMN